MLEKKWIYLVDSKQQKWISQSICVILWIIWAADGLLLQIEMSDLSLFKLLFNITSTFTLFLKLLNCIKSVWTMSWTVCRAKQYCRANICSQQLSQSRHYVAALQAATILVAMASGKNIWRLKFLRKSPIGDLQIKRETYLKKYQK